MSRGSAYSTGVRSENRNLTANGVAPCLAPPLSTGALFGLSFSANAEAPSPSPEAKPGMAAPVLEPSPAKP